MENEEKMMIYEKTRSVPENAQKIIPAGRLAGFIDINPMWRIKILTEIFGPCGVGWKYEIIDKRLENGANDVVVAFLDINLYIKYKEEWSEAIPATGGSSFISKERGGLYTSDECFKMALTDAIGVACKYLGIGADIYWKEDMTKYNKEEQKNIICSECGNKITQAKTKKGEIISEKEFSEYTFEITGKNLCIKCFQKWIGENKNTN